MSNNFKRFVKKSNYGLLALLCLPLSLMAKTIGVIVPMEHSALNDIVAGFQDTIEQSVNGKNTEIIVKNAQGDMNLQRAIIQQMQAQQLDMYVPIGTAATQMTLSMEKRAPVLALAAIYTEDERQKQKPIHMTGVLDEVAVAKHFALLNKLIPNLKTFTLIYSHSEKVFNDVDALSQLAKEKGVTLQKLMVQALPDLYTVSRQLDPNTQAIFVLKDHLIVSGMPTLAREAEKRHIPVIASDEGSVHQGAAVALGVSEREIGVQGAALAIKLLGGAAIDSLPLEKMSHLSLFLNVKNANKQNMSVQQVDSVAKELGYSVKDVK